MAVCAFLGFACQTSSEGDGPDPTSVAPGPTSNQEEPVSEPSDSGCARPASASVSFEQGDQQIRVLLGGKPFTAFHYGDQWDKPFLYPLRTSSGTAISRGYPVQPRPGEKRDHHWHRGIWYGHGDLNGHDFWRELGRDKTGMVVPLSAPAFEGGTERGMLVAELGFRTAEGQVLGSAFHRYTFSHLGSLIFIDAAIAIRADREQDLRFGDTDDGGFAMRLSDDFRQDHGAVLLNSEGQRDTENIWGQAARWVDYSAAVDGKRVGVALLDHPSNLRHPARWHARGYSLCSANPFGLASFTRDRTRKGGYTLPRGETLTFGYRVIIHEGETAREDIESLYADFAARQAP